MGVIETLGLVGAIEAADVMVKTASVHIIEWRLVGSGLVSVTVMGEVAAVKSAVEAAVVRAGRVAPVVAHHIIPRPSEGLLEVASRKGGHES